MITKELKNWQVNIWRDELGERATLRFDNESETRIYDVFVDHFKYSIYDNVLKKGMLNETCRYTFHKGQFYLNPLLTWVINGLHGMPKELLLSE